MNMFNVTDEQRELWRAWEERSKLHQQKVARRMKVFATAVGVLLAIGAAVYMVYTR